MPIWPPNETVLSMLLLAPFIGSFGGVLVRRLPRSMPVVVGRSVCEACGHRLGIRDLVPLLSFAALRGRCRHCHAPIAWMHVGIEVASLAVAASAALVDGDDPARLIVGCLLGWALLVLAWIDWTALLLPDVLTLPLVLVGLGAVAALEPDTLADHAVAAIAGYLAFAAIAAVYRWRRGRDGMGGGDAKLMAAAGAWLGVGGLAPVMAGGAVLGLAWAGLQRLRSQPVSAGAELAFGPWLALATWCAWLLRIGW